MASPTTRAATLADTLRQAICGGKFVCGERLVELTLSQQMNVSQNTVRDALHILQEEGWVIKHARRGAHVRSFTAAEAAEVYALWAAVEKVALRWALAAFTKNSLAQLRRLIKQARTQAYTGDGSGSTQSLLALHTAIGAMASRPQTIGLLMRLHNQVHLLEILRQTRAPRSPHLHEAQFLLYEKLVSLMEARQDDDAERLLEYLINSDLETLLPLLT